ncbi:MAG: hypothetical protein IT429_17300 [Gemmataceae bacterium]|nr:hypothetical protein [Gemmataceae bacterium]
MHRTFVSLTALSLLGIVIGCNSLDKADSHDCDCAPAPGPGLLHPVPTIGGPAAPAIVEPASPAITDPGLEKLKPMPPASDGIKKGEAEEIPAPK